MDTQKQPEKKKTISWWKLALVGVAAFIFGIVGLVVGFIVYTSVSTGHGSTLCYFFYSPPWRNKFYQGFNGWDNMDHEKAVALMRAGIAEAEAARAPTVDLMQLHRSLARRYYDDDDLEHGDPEIAKAIELCPANPSNGSLEADILVHAYQDRAWANHDLWWKGKKASNGVADQEKCVELTIKYFGENDHQTIMKIPSLAAIYAEVGEHGKAANIMQKALEAANTTNKDCAWFVYTMKARVDAAEHRFRDAVASYEKAAQLAKATEPERPWLELKLGLRYGDNFPPSPPPESTALFKKSLFSEIEQRASQLRHSQTQMANGRWELDRFYGGITQTDRTEDDYAQKIFDLKKWLKQDPNSVTARNCLAGVYVNYAWLARGSGYADSVTSAGWKKFGERIQQAKATLDADPQIRSKCPRAYHVYAIINRADGTGRETFMADVDACHKRWPTYRIVDFDTCFSLLPRWYGAQYDTERFIIKRADEIGGNAGDIFCAQAVWENYYAFDDLFAQQNPIKWPRVKAGFKDIFAKFPQSLDARMMYLTMAEKVGDSPAALEAFDGYNPPKPALQHGLEGAEH